VDCSPVYQRYSITDAILRVTLGLEQMKLLADALDHDRVADLVQNVYKKVEIFCEKSVRYYEMAPWGWLNHNHDSFALCN
jgi:hypothetical protein